MISLPVLKSKIKALIQKAYSLSLLPSVQKIKQMFIEFDLRKTDSWIEIGFLMLERLEVLRGEDDKPDQLIVEEEIEGDYLVRNKVNDNVYLISLNKSTLAQRCTCPDAHYRNRECKHQRFVSERLEAKKLQADKKSFYRMIETESRKFNCYTTDDSPMGLPSVSARIFHNRSKVGAINFDLISQTWTYSPSNYLSLKASSLADAIVLLLQRRGIDLATAAGLY